MKNGFEGAHCFTALKGKGGHRLVLQRWRITADRTGMMGGPALSRQPYWRFAKNAISVAIYSRADEPGTTASPTWRSARTSAITSILGPLYQRAKDLEPVASLPRQSRWHGLQRPGGNRDSQTRSAVRSANASPSPASTKSVTVTWESALLAPERTLKSRVRPADYWIAGSSRSGRLNVCDCMGG
jgi:hypothetical protein